MSSLNRVQIIGYLGADPESRTTAAGSAVANFRVATTEKWTDKNSGEQKERTEWHSLTAWGRLAEIVAEYLRKGSQVYVDGQLRTDKWDDKEGNTRYTTKINVQNLIMLGSPNTGRERKQTAQQAKKQEQEDGGAPYDDDIPF